MKGTISSSITSEEFQRSVQKAVFQFFQLGNEHSPAHHDLGRSQQRSEKKRGHIVLEKKSSGPLCLQMGYFTANPMVLPHSEFTQSRVAVGGEVRSKPNF